MTPQPITPQPNWADLHPELAAKSKIRGRVEDTAVVKALDNARLNWCSPADCVVCKKYLAERARLSNKTNKKKIAKLNSAQRLHEGLYNQDVVGLEREYVDKMSELRQQPKETKILKVDFPKNEAPTQCVEPSNNVVNKVPEQCETPPNNVVRAVNGVTEQCYTPASNVIPSDPANNVALDDSSKNVLTPDPFADMYPVSLNHIIPKLYQAYPHYRVFRKGTKYEYSTLQYEIFGPEFIAGPFTDAIRTRDGMHEYPVYFTTQMTVLEYREQHRENENALIESSSRKPKTYLSFYKKRKKHH